MRRGFAVAASILLVNRSALPAVSAGEQFDFFEARIRPVFIERCYPCHSATSDKLKGGLRVDSRQGLLQGGKSGQPAIVAGHAERSLLIEAIRYGNEKLQMPPPDRGERLSEKQIADFVTWINAGAADPRQEQSAAASQVPEKAGAHWAFKAPVSPPVPGVKMKSWPHSPIDHFVLAKLEANGFRPAPAADRRTLIRRATYDLIGLPPTPEEVDAFTHDNARDAFARVVDRLLASPHYGERWGRHWLDVARYSDTKGYVYDREEKRFVHSHVYRDWVIRALNEDMPYDRFLIAQIAGDQLEPALVAPRVPSRTDLAGLGFLTVGRRFLGVQHEIIDDRIDVLTRGTMGLTVACARCHDHKYDPIPIQDYYSLYGVFNSCSEVTVPLKSGSFSQSPKEGSDAYVKGLREREEKLQKTFEKKREELNSRLRAKAAEYLLAVLDVAKLPTEEFYTLAGPEDLNPVVVRQWEAYIFKARGQANSIFRPWHELATLGPKDFPDKAAVFLTGLSMASNNAARVNRLVLGTLSRSPLNSMRDAAQRYGEVFAEVEKTWSAIVQTARTNKVEPPRSPEPDQEEIRLVLYGADSPASVPHGAIVDVEWFFDEGTRVELSKLHAEIDRWMITATDAPPHAVILADRPQPKNARVFLRGNPANKGEEVPRQFLQVVAGPGRKPFERGSGRLELAQAIASRENPLTARVMVNRVWMHHFGAGLVRTPSDFGTRAESPTHPELLDWLAIWFMDHGWSLKKLHRLILLSNAYQQSSDEEMEVRAGWLFTYTVEPRARNKRSPAQADPDNRLLWRMNKHRLDFEAMRDSLLAVTGELDPAIGGKPVELFGNKPTARRTVYGYIDRQFLPGVFRVFDFANPDLHIPQRSDTTVPQQALFFMNNAFVVERARALVKRPDVQHRNETPERIRQLYRVVYQREPTKTQLRLALEFTRSAIAEPPPPAPATPATPWQYGYGEYDETAQRVKNFERLPHFTGDAWQGGPAWPDDKLGWVQLSADGGHAGNDLKHAAIRRWVAPLDGALSISGSLKHEHQPGDGINARVVSSREGLLGNWIVHNGKVETQIQRTEVKMGDTLDFVVDFRANLHSDMFKWAQILRVLEPNAASDPLEWSARKEFAGPPAPLPHPLSAWEKYAQALLEANEFIFVD
jgi:hypothetical protein